MDSSHPDLLESLRGERALVFCLSQSWGGLEQVAAQDSVEAASRGLDVQVLVYEGSPIHERLSKKGVLRCHPIAYRPRNNLDLKLRAEIRRLIDREGVSLLHSHQTSILGSIVPWIWDRPRVAMFATRHIMNDHDKNTLWHRAIYRRLDSLIVMSEALRQNVLETHPLRERRVKVINLGLDFDWFEPSKVNAQARRASFGADDQTCVIGMVGRIDPAKGQATFIKAAAGLLKNPHEGEKIKFVIVGEETRGSDQAKAHLEELRSMVRQFHLEKQVHFAGFQDNVPEVMQAFDIFVMPSRQEAFGLVAIEAMAMECPVIISSGGSSTEIAGPNGEFGRIMRPDDAFDLQQQLRSLLDNPEERRQMGLRAREHVRKHYDRRVRVATTLELYAWALRRRRNL